MVANYFIALQSGVLRGSKSFDEKTKITKFVGSNFDCKDSNRRQK